MMRRQVRTVAASGVVSVVVIAVVVFWAMIEYAQVREESVVGHELSQGLNDLQYLTTEYLATGTQRALEQWETRHASLGKFLSNVTIQDPEVKRLIPEVETRHRTLGSVFRKLIAIKERGDGSKRSRAAEQVAIQRLLSEVLGLSTVHARIVSIYENRSNVFLTQTSSIVGVLLLGVIGGIILLYFRVLRNITNTLDHLSETILHLGDGGFETPIAIHGDGDIATLFSAIEQTRRRLALAVDELQQERADLDHFVYVASHDFKAPLRGIDNLAVWAEEDAGDALNDEAREHLHMLRRRVARLETLLEDLLAYSRAGRVNVPSEDVDVGELLNEVVDDLNLREGITVKVAPDLPVVHSPSAPLAHVFINLIGNAAKHHDKDQGVIEIKGSKHDKGYKFSVIDDGPGIQMRFRERIFELFQTLKPRDVVEGSGMGLSIAKRLVQGYNGKIAVVGDEGRGTCIEFTWNPDGV